MYCSKCGASVADGIAFCSACGQPMVGFSVGQAAGAPASATPAAPGGTVYAPPAQAGLMLQPRVRRGLRRILAALRRLHH